MFIKDRFYHYNYLEPWEINLDGEVRRVEDKSRKEELLSLIEQNEKDMVNIRSRLRYPYGNSLIKIKRIGISTRKQLVINQFELFQHKNGMAAWTIPPEESEITLLAEADKDENIWVFEDRSTVRVDPTGFLVFTSSVSSIPQFYIPTILEQALGMATAEDFAGNEFFQLSKLCYLKLSKVESSEKYVINAIRMLCPGVSEEEARQLYDDHPVLLPGVWKYDQAMIKQMEFKDEDIEVESILINPQASHQERISLTTFFERYIQRFVSQVLRPPSSQ